MGFLMMPLVGLEPTRCCHHGILSPARLPIPPQRQICRMDSIQQNGTYRARTYDPLLVRQMLSQLS